MNAIWTYVKQVERRLPRARRIETVGALYATLKARKMALEKELGRKATAAEIDALLTAEGEPSDVAARIARPRGAGGDGLVERYLAAVGGRLPPEGAHDVLAELREAIGERIEARETETGSAAGKDDIAAILKEFGHPVLAAARYTGREHLIGPKLFPWFWPAQRAAIGVVVVLGIVIAGVRAVQAGDPMDVVRGAFGMIWEMALYAFAIVTIVFVVLERTGQDIKIEAHWNPRQLPRDEIRKPRSLFESLFALAFDAIFIAWWLGVVSFPNHWPDRTPSVALDFAAVWAPLHLPVLALAVLQMAVHAGDVIYPGWSRARAAVSIIGHIGGLAILWVLFRADQVIDVSAVEGVATTTRPGPAEVQGWIDVTLGWALWLTALGWAAVIGVEVWRLMQSVRTAPARDMARRG